MVPAIYNLPTGYRGDTYGPIIFKFLNKSGSGISIEGTTGNLQVREGANLPSVLNWSTTDGSMNISGNQLELSPKIGSCMQIEPKNYVYDLQLSSGEITRTYVKGSLPIIGDITQI
jgi:hypothetical protein